VIDRHVEETLQHDVIEPAVSPWCSNVLVVTKRDGTMRFCVNYRKTNQLIKKNKFPLPKIDTCLDTLNRCRYFSSWDLRQGYWQIVIDEKDLTKPLSSHAKVSGDLKCSVSGFAIPRVSFPARWNLFCPGLLMTFVSPI